MASRRTFSLFSPRLIFTSASISVSVSILQGIARFSSSLSPHTKFTFKCDKDNSKWAADSSTNTNDCTEEENLYAILTDNRHGRWNITQDWVNYETEENEETSPSEQSMKRDAHKICRILDNGIKDYTAFEQRFAPFISKLTPQLVCRVISSCSNNVVLPAISFFFWTQHQPGYRHNSATFDAVIHFAAKSHDFHLMSRLMKECKRCGFSFTPKTFSFVIDEGGTLKYHVLDAVLRAINDISKRDSRVKSRDAFDALLSTLCNANQLDTALQVLRGMVPTGFWPTVHTSRCIMQRRKIRGCKPADGRYEREGL